jgi:hypothetical protein
LDLKPLPNGLKYAYLEDTNNYHVIISSNLSWTDEEKLLTILKDHQNFSGMHLMISPSVDMHRIPIMEDVEPIVDTQKHVHPQMKDVVKKKRGCSLP